MYPQDQVCLFPIFCSLKREKQSDIDTYTTHTKTTVYSLHFEKKKKVFKIYGKPNNTERPTPKKKTKHELKKIQTHDHKTIIHTQQQPNF